MFELTLALRRSLAVAGDPDGAMPLPPMLRGLVLTDGQREQLGLLQKMGRPR